MQVTCQSRNCKANKIYPDNVLIMGNNALSIERLYGHQNIEQFLKRLNFMSEWS